MANQNHDEIKRLFEEVAQNLREMAEIHAQLSRNHMTIAWEFARRIEELGEMAQNGERSLDLVAPRPANGTQLTERQPGA